MKKVVFILSLVFFIVLPFVSYSASVPPLINYQGMLTDAQGQPVVSGTNKLTFNIYDAVIGGNLVWGPQVFDSVPVINGMFNVILGTTDTGGRSILDAFDADSRFLGIIIESGSEISPRQQILSTPYSIQAERAVDSNLLNGQTPQWYAPVGSVIAYFGTTAPDGWLFCDGSAIGADSKFDILKTVLGSTNVPNLTDMFLRGKSASRTVGDLEMDEIRSHNHSPDGGGYFMIRAGALKTWDFSSVGANIGQQAKTANFGGTETRPINIAVNYIIKY